MSISVNGLSTVPPGFRFHPTEEELLSYYLRKKVQSELFDLNVIRDIDLNKLEPWDIQEKCRVGTTPQNDWYFFSHKDKKYPTGTRTNRATSAGFWKATGRDKVIYASLRRIGMRKTLVFYMGRAPRGQKSDWIMHEYRLDEICDSDSQSNGSSLIAENQLAPEEGWVICRVFKKKNHHKQPPQTSHSSSENSLDKILHYNTTISCTHHHTRNLRPIDTLLSRATSLIHERFAKLPALAGPAHPVQETDGETGFGDWTVLDRLVSYDLDGAYPFCPPATHFLGDGGGGGGGEEDDGDLWSLTRLSGSGQVGHVSRDK